VEGKHCIPALRYDGRQRQTEKTERDPKKQKEIEKKEVQKTKRDKKSRKK
jgi:hypothetical protein